MPVSPLGRIAAGVALALAGCAQQPPTGPAAAGRSCFFAGNVNGFGAATDSSVNIQVGANRYYRLDLVGTCHDINWSTGLLFRTTAGSNWVCGGADAEVIVPGRQGGRCLVTGVRPISREEWRATPKP